jgi:hypothetical protein
MTATRVILACLYSGAFASIVRAQAAVEYAAKSASSALSGTGAGTHLGVCPLDSAVVSCVHRFYPAAFYFAIVVICVFLGALLHPKRRT